MINPKLWDTKVSNVRIEKEGDVFNIIEEGKIYCPSYNSSVPKFNSSPKWEDYLRKHTRNTKKEADKLYDSLVAEHTSKHRIIKETTFKD
jgi:hypothetical protein